MQARSSLFFFFSAKGKLDPVFFFFWGHQHGRREVMRKPRIQDAKIAWVGFDERGNQTVRRKPSKSSWDPLYSGCCLVRIRVQYSISFPEPALPLSSWPKGSQPLGKRLLHSFMVCVLRMILRLSSIRPLKSETDLSALLSRQPYQV